jgi:cell division protein ZapA (FtsZ GTPase activity inhibitor)
MEEFSITVSIADRNYRLRIQPKDEEIIRKAAKEINELMREYAAIYAYTDNQDLLAMAALNYTTAAMNAEGQRSSVHTEIIQKLSAIDQELKHHV